MSHWGRNNKSFYKSRLTAYNKCAHAVSLKIGLAYTPIYSTTDHWIKESIKWIFSSGLLFVYNEHFDIPTYCRI